MEESPIEKSTPREIRERVQELLRYGYLSSDEKSQSFAQALRLQNEIREALEPLDLDSGAR